MLLSLGPTTLTTCGVAHALKNKAIKINDTNFFNTVLFNNIFN
jgi:hypothetical protein